jgi:hypothetical protein
MFRLHPPLQNGSVSHYHPQISALSLSLSAIYDFVVITGDGSWRSACVLVCSGLERESRNDLYYAKTFMKKLRLTSKRKYFDV